MTARLEVLFVAALPAEGQALIRRFGLKRDAHAAGFDTYRGDSVSLVVSGVGKLRSAAATAAFLARQPEGAAVHAVNVGIAGATPSSGVVVGEVRLINKLLDAASQLEQFPDLLVDTGLREACLTTVDRPLTAAPPSVPAGLVDMEGTGFFEAAAVFLPPHRVGCLKVVSDDLDGGRLKRGEAAALVFAAAPAIERYLERIRAAHRPEPPVLGAEDRRWLAAAGAALDLTVSQGRLLEEWTAAYRVCRGLPLPEIPEPMLTPPQNKRERSERLRALGRLLGGWG